MASQKTKRGPSSPERRERGQRHRSPGGGIGGYGGLAAVLVGVAVVVVSLFALSSSDGTPDAVQLAQPSATAQTGTDQTTGPTVSPTEVPEGLGGSGQTGTDEATGPPTTEEHEPNFHWPPEGALPALPEPGKHGELIMSERNTDTGRNPQYFLQVFADGRVFWQRWFVGGPYITKSGDERWEVRRLTAMGIDLVQRGVTADMGNDTCCSAATRAWSRRHPLLDPFGLPEGAWKDPGPHVYRPARYAVCPSGSSDDTWLPPRVRMILRGSEGGYHRRCVVVTAEDALRLDEILPDRTLSWGPWSRLMLVPLLPDATLLTRSRWAALGPPV